jgi:hypothetical protein
MPSPSTLERVALAVGEFVGELLAASLPDLMLWLLELAAGHG